MSRRSLILCLSVLGGLLAAVGVAFAVLFSDGESSCQESSSDLPAVLSAVPSDAMLLSYGKASDLCPLSDVLSDELKKCDAAVSLHYPGKLHALYVVDVRREDEHVRNSLVAYLDSEGMSVGAAEDLVLFSESDNLVKSALRHLDEDVSVVDKQGFVEAFESADGDNVVIVSGLHAKRLMSAAFTRKISKHSGFISKVADWYALEVDDGQGIRLSGDIIYEGEPDEFMTAFKNCVPGKSSVAECLPSYTLFALSIPVENQEVFRQDYQTFADSRGMLNSMKTKQNSLTRQYGISPEELFTRLKVKEVATAFLVAGSRLEKINLMRIGSKDAELIFKDPAITTLRGYMPVTHEWKYPSSVSSVYGDMFSLPDEACFTYIDGWLVVGSRNAIDEYVTKDALSYTLEEYASHAGVKNVLSDKSALAVAYFSLTAEKDRLGNYLDKDFQKGLWGFIGEPEFAPVVLSIGRDNDRERLDLSVQALTLSRSKAPTVDRDTTVVIPKGPFRLEDSRTGKTHLFYQNKHNYLCLKEEGGKDLWGVPFSMPICGTAHNVDISDNGKQQIIFGSGSSMYVIDLKGRYVYGYPVDLKKKITLGPDIHEVDGKLAAIVLHDDNSVEMYDLRGRRIPSWKTIELSEETIKSLPQRIAVGDKYCWVLRTSIQTLIYPSVGGKPITDFKGDSKIKPDSEIVLSQEDVSVQVQCYDGKTRTVKLK